MRSQYPEIEPFDTGFLAVDGRHRLFYEQCGNPQGKPVVMLHGGPGAGCGARMRRFHDPARYRIILFDQRGCGRSTPHASLRDNTTWDLVADIERLREHLRIDRWQVFGGSWGSTLALAYAETHPDRVTELVLRGIFMLRRRELEWFYQDGASALFPDAWEEYVSAIPEAERGDLMRAYHARLTHPDPRVQLIAARAWSRWEASTSFLTPNRDFIAQVSVDSFAIAFARIESHYFAHDGFFDRDDQLLEDIGRIRDIPAVIEQGRYDVVCPMMSAWDLHKSWPEAEFI